MENLEENESVQLYTKAWLLSQDDYSIIEWEENQNSKLQFHFSSLAAWNLGHIFKSLLIYPKNSVLCCEAFWHCIGVNGQTDDTTVQWFRSAVQLCDPNTSRHDRDEMLFCFATALLEKLRDDFKDTSNTDTIKSQLILECNKVFQLICDDNIIESSTLTSQQIADRMCNYGVFLEELRSDCTKAMVCCIGTNESVRRMKKNKK